MPSGVQIVGKEVSPMKIKWDIISLKSNGMKN